MSRLLECRLIVLPQAADPRGNLTIAEQNMQVPFAIKRVFFLTDVPGDGARGGHAHFEMEQLMIAVTGAFDVMLDDGRARRRVRLSKPTEALYIPPMIWREMERFSAGAVMAVLASTPYSAIDYIRDHDEFKRSAQAQFN